MFIWPQLLNLEFTYETGEGERGGERRRRERKGEKVREGWGEG